jgi:hypothetical protein
MIQHKNHLTIVRKYTSALLGISLMVVLMLSCRSSGYTRFRYTEWTGEKYVTSNELPSPEFTQNLIVVLDFDRIPYIKDDQGYIMIPEDVWKDKNTMWNLSWQAEDETTLNEIKRLNRELGWGQ